MALLLKALNTHDPMADPINVRMQGDRLTVGRGTSNDLVLPDPERFLSKQHCVLERAGAGYVVMDTSTNGTFLNYQPERLDNVPTPLNKGDVIQVGAFELVVEIEASDDAPVEDLPPCEPAPNRHSHRSDPLAEAIDAEDDNDFLDALLGAPEAPPASPLGAVRMQPGASAPYHSPAAQDFFQPPRATHQAIPDDWEDSFMAAKPAAELAPAVASLSPDTTLNSFLEGLGVPGLTIEPAETEEVMARMGRVMATMIDGMREIMMTRAALKSEMRVARTMIQSDRNNTLKFSVSTEQAIEAMVRPQSRGYLAPEDAAAEVLRDIKAHEVATMTGMEAALKDLLAQLCPDRLSARIEEASGFTSFLGNKKARSWEAYARHYAELAARTEDDFQSTFGKEFARAYEDQIRKL